MSLKNAIGGVALLAGTAIGAAVLALPIVTAHMGFTQATLIYLLCWFFMTMGALYLLEVNLFVGYGTNLISMAEKTLGKSGKIFTWIIYLILLYALTAAYLTGAGAWLQEGFHHFNTAVSPIDCALLASCVTTLILFFGTAVTDWINRFLMIGLIGAFATLLFATVGHVKLALLFSQSIKVDLTPIPIIITAFGSAIVIPTLTEYLHGKPRQLFYVVLTGSLIPLLLYIVWEFVIMGIIPFPGRLQQSSQLLIDLPRALKTHLQNPIITKAAIYFSIFALITSLLGVTLSLFDFLADGLHLRKTIINRSLLALIAFLPPLSFVIFYPQGFSFALSFAGLFVALLLGILPAVMAWRGRYHLKKERPLQMIGGKALIIMTIIFFLCVMCIECYNQYVAY